MRTWRSENFFSSSRVRLCERVLVGAVGKGWGFGDVPLLDFVEAGEKGNGDEYDDCFFAVADFDL